MPVTPQDQKLIHEIPFDSERKAMSVVLKDSSGKVAMHTKGAAEIILGMSQHELRGGQVVPLTEDRKREILELNGQMAGRSLRVLALAYRIYADVPPAYEEKDLVFSALIGMLDPPREEVKVAVQKCHDAGIRPIMITGDHPATALAIAKELGIARKEDGVVSGTELDQWSDKELSARVEQISVYARVSPAHKLRIVQAWKSMGQIVAMTGDGVNDAPAVKAADIGIAMGLSGTDVTKEAAAMVLTDDNFASIVSAVEEGRGIYDNIQKFLLYLLAGNVGLVLFVFIASVMGWPFPMTPTQILWMNLVTNGLPALALGMEPPEPDIMRRRPRRPGEPILGFHAILLTLAIGLLVAAVTTISFAVVYQWQEANLPQARTIAFCVVSYAFIFSSFAFRSARRTMPELGFFSNPALLGAVGVSCLLQMSVVMLPFARPVFETANHFAWEWALIGLLSLTPVTIMETVKIIRMRWFQSQGHLPV